MFGLQLFTPAARRICDRNTKKYIYGKTLARHSKDFEYTCSYKIETKRKSFTSSQKSRYSTTVSSHFWKNTGVMVTIIWVLVKDVLAPFQRLTGIPTGNDGALHYDSEVQVPGQLHHHKQSLKLECQVGKVKEASMQSNMAATCISSQ